jgi:hypothetical protein
VGAADQCKQPACWRGANPDWPHLIFLSYVAPASDIGPEAISSGIPELPESRGVNGARKGPIDRLSGWGKARSPADREVTE